MTERKVRIRYDTEGDYLEVMFDQKPGCFRETSSDQVMEKVDEAGNLRGFSVMKLSALKKAPLKLSCESPPSESLSRGGWSAVRQRL
jgi:hypothetical protein